MDGGDLERAVAKATLDAVRQTTSRKRNRRRPSQNLSHSTASYNLSTSPSLPRGDIFDEECLPADLEEDVEFCEEGMHEMIAMTPQLPTPVELAMLPNETNSGLLQMVPLSPPPSMLPIAADLRSFPQDSFAYDSIEEKVASSIMDYMDSVFFLQFPLHSPVATIGGRGWLLWMLIHVKPFQIITHALCTECHRSLQGRSSRTDPKFAQERGAEESFSHLLSELSHHIGQVNLQNADVREGKIGILACTVQLIFLEVIINSMPFHHGKQYISNLINITGLSRGLFDVENASRGSIKSCSISDSCEPLHHNYPHIMQAESTNKTNRNTSAVRIPVGYIQPLMTMNLDSLPPYLSGSM